MHREPTLISAILALLWLPVVALAVGIIKAGEYLTRRKEAK